MSMNQLEFTIVIPVYHNELNLPETLPRLAQLRQKFEGVRLKVILVDDGSRDHSFEVLKDWQAKVPDLFQVAKLSRNFGQIDAIRAGLSLAQGDCVGIVSADLQDPPETFLKMFEEWKKGAHVVMAVREHREETGIGVLLSRTYWRMLRHLALPGYPQEGFDFCLLDRSVVNVLNQMHEKNTQIFPLIYSLGFRRSTVLYDRLKREKGVSQWTFLKKIKLFIDTFISFSYLPVRMISFVGFVVAILSLLFSASMIVGYFYFDRVVSGWTSIVVLVSGLGGLTLLALGILGEYLWRILDQVRKRPLYIFERQIGFEGTQTPYHHYLDREVHEQCKVNF